MSTPSRTLVDTDLNSAIVPTIDLSLLQRSQRDRDELAEAVRACCHEGCGFFYLVGHGVPAELFRAVFAMTKSAFALPADVKAGIDKRASSHFRGYESAGSEKTGGRPDHREQIDTWSELPVAPHVHGQPKWMRLYGPNQFFDEVTLPGYRELTLEWHHRLSAVSVRLLEVLSLALSMAPDALDSRFGSQRMSLIKYIRYPRTPDGGQGVGLHQDSAYLTLLAPGEEDGLEVQLPTGEMMPVGRVEGAFVVNLGEALQLMTGNYFLATPHRVITKAERFSVGFFYGLSLDTSLKPIELPEKLRAAVEASERHRMSGTMPTKEELEQGLQGSFDGRARHETYGDMLWNYFSRAYPENMRMHYPIG